MTWPLASLGELLDAKAGFASGDSVEDGIIQVRMNNVSSEGALDWSRVRRVPVPRRGVQAVLAEKGDVLFNATNSPELVGKSAYFPGFSEPVTFSNHFLRLRPGPRLEGRFLAYWLRSQWGARVFERMCRAWVNQASVPREQLLKLEIPLPAIEEQRRIAAILDQAAGLREIRRRSLDGLARLERAHFVDLFGDLTANPKHWPITRLSDAITSVTNGLTRRASANDDGRDIVLRLRDIRSGEIDFSNPGRITLSNDETKRFAVVNRDILFVRVNGNPAYVGRCAVFNEVNMPTYFNDHIMRVRIDESLLNSNYLQAALTTEYGKGQISTHRKTSAGQHTINQDGLSKIAVPTPPIELQRAFENGLAALRATKTQLLLGQARLDALFASLQHRAFTGELMRSSDLLRRTT